MVTTTPRSVARFLRDARADIKVHAATERADLRKDA
jgi:hypothetical protein